MVLAPAEGAWLRPMSMGGQVGLRVPWDVRENLSAKRNPADANALGGSASLHASSLQLTGVTMQLQFSCLACAGLPLKCAFLLWPTYHSVVSPLHTDATAVQAFFDSGLINVAGCTISTFNSSQQWDFPSSWPPTEWMMITALQNYGGEPPCLCRLLRTRLCTDSSLNLSCMAALCAGWGPCTAAAIHGLDWLQQLLPVISRSL